MLMRNRAIDNRPDIDTEITRDCPIARKILTIILLIFNVFTAMHVWQIYQKTSSPKPLVLLIFFTITVIHGAIWYTRPVSRNLNSDMIIIIYGMILITTIAIIKHATFFYLNIDVKKLPVIYEKWNVAFDLVSFAIAFAAAALPNIIKHRIQQTT